MAASCVRTIESTNGLKGQSFSLYDASRRIWHQSWATNRGQLLTIEGRIEDGEMVLGGSDRAADGVERLVRGTWQPVKGGVRETAVTSLDAGKTWQPWFDLVFRPHSSGEGVNSSTENDATIIARLDTEYQAAVKKNDAVAMDRLLADDFVLVTGSGKIYRKSDLLQEARSGRVIYDRQEDTLQKVHVWAMPRLSPLSCGRKAWRTESHSTIHFGSRTLMCALRQDGAMYLVNLHCRC